ncbi:hypothetical protein [Sphaerisporangium sp. NPDC051011]|uniref:hypothetical protein n=1 Tax=Sphaerisporangium sp. NPDC051011 TaxID=3155792 RepID=UPI0033DE5140
MPGEPDDDYRVVLDEGSLDWRHLSKAELRDVLVVFGDLLEPLADGRLAAFMDPAYSTECLPDLTLGDLIYTPHPAVPRDERVRLAKLLDKCRALEPQEEDLPQFVRVNKDGWKEASWGMTHTLVRAATGRAMSCLVVPVTPGPSGWTTVNRETDQVDIHILSDPTEATGFWREIYTRELTPEDQFFTLSGLAFPELLFAPSLSFRRFKSAYTEVLPWLVRLLGALNDHFADDLTDHAGDHNQVMARFSALGLDISPESPLTRRNTKAWAERLVTYRDTEYRCEWHGKRLWDRDRVHFSLPIPEQDGRILIGIFVDHLS